MNDALARRIESFEKRALLHGLLLIAITLLAAALRFYKLGEWSFWIDEIYTLEDARETMLAFPTFQPLSEILVGSALRLLPVGEWSARLVPALAGIATVPALYALVRRAFGAAVALLAALLLAISPWHIEWSQNARFYTLLLLFYTLAQFFFFDWVESGRLRDLLLACLSLAFATFERVTALFFLPVAVAYLAALSLLPFQKVALRRVRQLAWFALPVIAYGLFRISSRIEVFETRLLAFSSNPLRLLLSIVYEIGIPLILLALAGAWFLYSQRSRAGLYLSLAAVIPIALLLVISPFSLTNSRYVFVALPSWILLGAAASKEILLNTPRSARVLALFAPLVLAAAALSQDALYYAYQNGNRPDWKGAFALVEARRAPEDLVFTTRPPIGEYYLGERVLPTLAIDPQELQAQGKRAWFVLDNRTGNLPAEVGRWLEKEARLVSVRDVSLPGQLLMMRVYLFDPAGP